MIAFERHIPRFPDEPRPASWPIEKTTYFTPLMALVAEWTAAYQAASNHQVKNELLRRYLEVPELALGVQVHAHNTIKSIYSKPPAEQDRVRKKNYQTLIKRIGEARGFPVTDISMEIDEIIEREGFEGPSKIPGISIVEKAEDRPDGEDCFNYSFKSDETSFTDFWAKEQRSYRSCLPIAGAIVFYESDMAGGIVHSGIVTERRTVISKWGATSPVFEHPVDYVPSFYGSASGCVRRV